MFAGTRPAVRLPYDLYLAALTRFTAAVSEMLLARTGNKTGRSS